METRLHENPAFYQVCGSTAGVGTFNNKTWFICTLECSNKDGKVYPGYYAFWRFNKDYKSKKLAIAACKNWLNTPLN